MTGSWDRGTFIATRSFGRPSAYRRICREESEEPYSYAYFYSSLSYLQSIGLILLLSTNVGRTYTNRIQLLCDPELLESIEKARFG